MAVRLKDIALLSGISRQAVAAALEGGGSSRVSERTREKVRKLARELNYVPNAAARKLRGGDGRTVGLLASPGLMISNTVRAEVSSILLSKGYSTLFMAQELEDLPTLCGKLESCGVSGIVVLDAADVPGRLVRVPDLPVIFCRCPSGGYDLNVDRELTGYISTRHLLEHGHKSVFYLTTDCSSGSRRRQGWSRALKEAGAAGRLIELRKLGGDADELERLLRREHVTALFCSNDYLAAKTMRALQDRGWRIPEDMAIVGCDGHSFVEFTRPTLTTVIQPVHELAEKCVDMLLERMARHQCGPVMESIDIPPRLWIGGSCGCPDRSLRTIYQISTTGNLERDHRMNFNASLWPETDENPPEDGAKPEGERA